MPNSLKPKMIYVEGGSFLMGNEQGGYDNEKPVHEVTLHRFYISKYPITVKQYRFFCDENRKKMPEKPSWGWLDDHPIINVSWNDAKEYCEWWKNGRLPTEAEWEFAARGGNESKGYEYSGGNQANNIAWYSDNARSKTYIVGSKAPNELNLFDMSGNVWEWCMDRYGNYHTESQPSHRNIFKGNKRIQRGGSWRTGIYQLRVTMRHSENTESKYNDVGFRLVKNISEEEQMIKLEKQHNLLNQKISELKQPIAELEEKLKKVKDFQ